MKNAGLRYERSDDWMPKESIDMFLCEDRRMHIYGCSGRDYISKDYLRKEQEK